LTDFQRFGPAARASGYKLHVSYKQHSGETISMFHVEHFFAKKPVTLTKGVISGQSDQKIRS